MMPDKKISQTSFKEICVAFSPCYHRSRSRRFQTCLFRISHQENLGGTEQADISRNRLDHFYIRHSATRRQKKDLGGKAYPSITPKKPKAQRAFRSSLLTLRSSNCSSVRFR
jgi:hypothetical protein